MAEEIKEHRVVESKEVQEGKFFAVIGYMTILCLVPLLLQKDNKFALFHGKQGLILFIGEVGVLIVNVIPILGQIVCVLGWVAFSILSLAGILQALMGKYWKMPVVGNIAEKINL